ncbi:MAG: helix-turn-helix transcriptional regulator [Clostridia bacterium]|nr:helix-turn-helix transcriptional regulator [Clostridia bacterium]
MKVENINPTLYGIYDYTYLCKERKNKKATQKTHYAYRLIFIKTGNPEIVISGKKYQLKSGDLVYMLPKVRYCFTKSDSDYSLINIMFDMRPYDSVYKKNTCISANAFNESLSSTVEDFDIPALNSSTVITAPELLYLLESLLLLDEKSPNYSFHAKSVILCALSSIVNFDNLSKIGSKANEIITYIKQHPELELTGDTLSKTFNYSKNHINHLVKKACNLSLSTLIRKVKINRAIVLIRESNLTLIEISNRLNYYDYSHFYKAFIKETGTAPTEYLK